MKSPGADKAIDSNSATKWFDYTNSPLQVQLATPLKVEAGFPNPIDQTAQVTQVEVRSWSEFRPMNSSGLIVACTTRLTTLCAPVAVHC